MKICFLAGSLAISGGTYVIFQHAAHLAACGHHVTIAAQEPFSVDTISWHDAARSLNCIGIEQARRHEFDVVIATWWKTALALPSFNAARYAYFVQSIESRFYPIDEGPLRRLIDATYLLPINFVTEARWIKDHLASDFGQSASLVRNGIRKDIYSQDVAPIEERTEGSPRILVEGHFRVSFKNTALAISLARRAGAKDVWLLTGSPIDWVPGVRRIFSQVPIDVAARVYRSCDVLVKLSTVEGMFGPPLEMFHCGGTAIVLDVSGHDEYIRHMENAIVVPMRDRAGALDAISSIIRDGRLLRSLKEGAKATSARWPSWAKSSAQFERWVASLESAPKSNHFEVTELVNTAFQEYDRDERRRLAANPWVSWRYGAYARLARLPPRALSLLENLNAILEVSLPPREIR
ncbi:glycosyltransferase family 4 protein [Bradyrhizobium sp. AUGA SZCCT0283]|uniref:glycosyltransferase family 4 protein n=1 Tax=Bradyrhizobium sp. AUGA SZCCT0283 TaxID=2807671 RepID=UPI001BACCECD|nr:glycosyltransferase family 4 protein [Bradyrhizobium sp. AUGA SZCCT0283]MBR1277486.1 glycosyltransferase family 4 protein [Bradyrhizobium sp. AUGA SZCCT0283]